MAREKGGTVLYCSRCRRNSPCRRVPDHEWNRERACEKSDVFGSCYSAGQPEIHYYRRPRQCLECGHRFITVELGEDYLAELTRYRTRLNELQPLLQRLQRLGEELDPQHRPKR